MSLTVRGGGAAKVGYVRASICESASPFVGDEVSAGCTGVAANVIRDAGFDRRCQSCDWRGLVAIGENEIAVKTLINMRGSRMGFKVHVRVMVNDSEVVPVSNVFGELREIKAIMDIKRELVGARNGTHSLDSGIVY